jgi:hypothetical protein
MSNFNLGQNFLIFSLLLYFIELILFSLLKKQFKRKRDMGKRFSDALAQAFNRLNIKHIVLYSSIYFLFLLIAKKYLFVFFIILGYQMVSVAFDLVMLYRIVLKK